MLIETSDGVPVIAERATDAAFEADPGAERVPLVLLHGLSQQRRYWGPVIRRLRRPVITLDQRGHGEAAIEGVDSGTDFSMDRLADDVMEVLQAFDVPQAIVVGHSWGASVALHAAVRHASAVRSVVLLDGGLFGPRHLEAGLSAGQVREALRPPPLGMLEPALWQAVSGGDLSPYWSQEIRDALAPTFRTDDSGRTFTRIGMDRHMAVLDGLIAYDPDPDIRAVACPAWAVSCEPRTVDVDAEDDPISRGWALARSERLANLPATFFLQRWSGALHDVPLQWPAMVAGLLETVVERIEPPREEAG